MSAHRLDDGRDTYTLSEKPQATPHQENRIVLVGGGPTSYGYVQFGRLVALVRGQRVDAARLSGRVAAAQPGLTIGVALVGKRYDIAKLKYANRPDNRPGAVSQAVPAAAAGERWFVDVATLVQQIADGAADYGFRVSTTSTVKRQLYAFDASVASWVLELELSEPSDAPAALEPASGSVGTGKPTLTWDGSEQQAELQVQVDPAANGDNPAFASGTVASTLRQYALATSTYAGLAVDATTSWRVRGRRSGDDWSDWSDWATFTHRQLRALTFTSPAAGDVTDPSPVIGGALDGGNAVRYQVIVTDPVTLATLYDSGEQSITPAPSFDEQIPTKGARGATVFPLDVPRTVELRAWDSADRRATPGVPAYSSITRTVTLRAGTTASPTALTVTQTEREPEIRVGLERASAPDGWVIERALATATGWTASQTAVRAEAGDGQVQGIGSGKYEWIDRTGRMAGRVRYRAATLTNGALSAFTAWVVVEPIVEGVWIVRADGTRIKLENEEISIALTERRTSLSPPGLEYDIETVTVLGGYAGDVGGTIDANTVPPIDAALEVLEDLRSRPKEVVRLVYAAVNAPVVLRAVDWAPDLDDWSPLRRRHNVSMGVQQVGEFPRGL